MSQQNRPRLGRFERGLENFSIEQLKSADMVIYGEKTYQGMADYWSKAEGETADYKNKIPKVVCSSAEASEDKGKTWRKDLEMTLKRVE